LRAFGVTLQFAPHRVKPHAGIADAVAAGVARPRCAQKHGAGACEKPTAIRLPNSPAAQPVLSGQKYSAALPIRDAVHGES